MIKFTLLALLCLGLGGIEGLYREDKVGDDGYHLEIKFDDGNCCKDTRDVNASPEDEPICLNSKNSQLIADQTLAVVRANQENSYATVKALKIPEFMVGKMTYQEWADNIIYNNYNLDGFSKLKELVSKYVLCKKVCKVFFYLRDSLKNYAAEADIFNSVEPEGRFVVVEGSLVILSDVRKDLEINFAANQQDPEDTPIVGVIFRADTLIVDVHLLDSKGWAGKLVLIESKNVIVPKTFAWYVTGNGQDINDGEIMAFNVENWDNYPEAHLETEPLCATCNMP